MKLSYVMVTHDRRERLLATLRLLRDRPTVAGGHETLLVDNASTDGSADAVADEHPEVHLIRNTTNAGVAARNAAIRRATGQYIALIDDDSYPVGDAMARAIGYLDATPTCGAVVGNVVLPDGRREASALPGVMIGCATVLRRSVLQRVGLFPENFVRQAEEYDLSFRIWNAGWSIDRFEDIVFRHDKAGPTRRNALVHRMDLRNNLIVARRYLPRALRREYARDWTMRYIAMARRDGFAGAARRGWWEATARPMRRRTVSPATVEVLLEPERQVLTINRWARDHGIRRVGIIDFAKNLYATWRACGENELDIAGVYDGNPALAEMSYRGLPILPLNALAAANIDGVVLANVNPAQIDDRLAAVGRHFAGPALRLWQPRRLAGPAPMPLEAAG